MNLRNAGGTSGGWASFLIGTVMMIAGGYLFLQSIIVRNDFSFGGNFSVGGINVTGGMVLIPFIFGIGIIFFNSRSFLGWGLMLASLVMLLFGIVSSVELRLVRMSAFELLSILVLLIGGIGLFLRSLRDLNGSI